MLSLILAAALGAAPSATAASSAVGLWSTPQDHGRVQVRECGAGLCGYATDGDHLRADPSVHDRMNKNPALRSRPLKGVPIFEGLTGGPPRWSGLVYNPVDGGTYTGSVTLKSADTLVLTGCVARILCQSQTWRRAE